MKKLFLIPLVALAGCSGGPLDATREYRAALEQRPGVSFGSQEEGRRATERFTALYADLSEENVRRRVRETYAPDAWFNDTVATEEGIDAIEKYLIKTATAFRDENGDGIVVVDPRANAERVYLKNSMYIVHIHYPSGGRKFVPKLCCSVISFIKF